MPLVAYAGSPPVVTPQEVTTHVRRRCTSPIARPGEEISVTPRLLWWMEGCSFPFSQPTASDVLTYCRKTAQYKHLAAEVTFVEDIYAKV